MKWELLEVAGGDDVRRLRISGGWLVQVAFTVTEESVAHDVPRVYASGWHPPVFVPDPEVTP